ncbi:Ferm And Pdz Domain-Containing Protein 2 [Manis pentadactyla]|nr:Ferm And Pdz Domain-Containing Protein 2 [Manis pentadactyla]
MKDRDEHPASAQCLVPDNRSNCSSTSKVWVTLARQDASLGIAFVPTLKSTTEPSGIHVYAHRRENLTFQDQQPQVQTNIACGLMSGET